MTTHPLIHICHCRCRPSQPLPVEETEGSDERGKSPPSSSNPAMDDDNKDEHNTTIGIACRVLLSQKWFLVR